MIQQEQAAYLDAMHIPICISRAPTVAPWTLVLGSQNTPCIAFVGPTGSYAALSVEAQAMLQRLHGLFQVGTLAWAEYESLPELNAFAPPTVFLCFGIVQSGPVYALPSLETLLVDPQAKRMVWDVLKKHCRIFLKPTT